MAKVGSFHYKFDHWGRQGNIYGGGITGGYMLNLNRALALDFGIGLGYLHSPDLDRYEVINGVRVWRYDEPTGWFGPINVGVSLIWNIGAPFRK